MMIYNQRRTFAIDPKCVGFVGIDVDYKTGGAQVYVQKAKTDTDYEFAYFDTEEEAKDYFEELVRWVDAEREKWCGDEKYTSRVLELERGADGKYKGKVTICRDIQRSEGEIRL